MIEEPDDILPDDLDMLPELVDQDGDKATPDVDLTEPYDGFVDRICREIERKR